MILDHISNINRYLGCHSDLVAAFAFLQECDLYRLEEGRHSILEDRIYAMVSKNKGKGREKAILEAHQKYVDIQYIVAGTDIIGWKSLCTCTQCIKPYKSDEDIMFFQDQPECWLSVPAGHFAIFFPEDGHAPLAGNGDVHKIVIKVASWQSHPTIF